MQIHVDKKNDVLIITVEGEIDLYNSPELRQQLTTYINKGSKKILLDFEKVKYIDSSGLATLIEGLQKVNRIKGELKLCGLNKSIKDIFEVARLDDVFMIHEKQEDALNGFKED